MSLSSLPLMKEVLGINPTEEDWLQYCEIAASPFGDFIVVAGESSAVFYIKKFNGSSDGDEPSVYFRLSKTYCPEPEYGCISAIAYLPVSIFLIWKISRESLFTWPKYWLLRHQFHEKFFSCQFSHESWLLMLIDVLFSREICKHFQMLQ